MKTPANIDFSEKARTTTVKDANIKAALYYQWNLPRVDGKIRMAYKVWHNGALLFAGNDLYPGAYGSIDGKEVIMSLLSFVAVQEGGVDSEYFANYTAEQLAFSRSYDAEKLGYAVGDWEEKHFAGLN